jgi:hypothetical protein
MSTRNRNRLPDPVEPDLPPYSPSDTSVSNSLAEMDAGYAPPMSDEYMDTAPEDVVNDVAEQAEVRRAEPAERRVTSSTMDLSFINKLNDPNLTEEQAAAEYNNLPPALRYVYDRVADFSYNNEGSETPAQLDPRDANRWLDEFYERETKAKPEDKANKPLGPRELQVAMDDVALMRNTIDSIKNHEGRSKALGYRGPFNVAAPSYWGGVVDQETGKQRPAAGTAAAGFSSLIDSSRAKVFLPVIQRMRGFGSMQVREAEAAVNSANRLSLELSDSDFGAALSEVEDFADRFEARSKGVPVEEIKAARTGGQPQSGAAAPARNTFVYDGSTYERQPDGTARLIE